MTTRTPQTVQVVPLTEERVAEVVPIHLDAFGEALNGRLGAPYARALLRWFVRQPEAIALVAVADDGRALGYVAGTRAGYGPTMTRDLLPAALAGLARRPWALLDRRFAATAVRRVAALLGRGVGLGPRSTPETHPGEPRLPEPVWSLVAIGVARAARGSGAGSALVDRFERQARLLGAASVRLSVYADNAPARRLYDRRGWTVVGPAPAPPPAEALYYGKLLPPPGTERSTLVPP